jgi:hypothetical protein
LRVDLRGSRVGGNRSTGGGRAAKQKSTTEAGVLDPLRGAEGCNAIAPLCSVENRDDAGVFRGALRRMSVGVDGVVARGGADREVWLAASAAVSAIFF